MNIIIVLFFGAVAGISSYFNNLACAGNGLPSLSGKALSITVAAALGALAVWAIRIATHLILRNTLTRSGVRERYARYDSWCYSVFLLSVSGAAGVQLSVPVVYLSALAFLAAQFFFVISLIKKEPKGGEIFISLSWVSFLFLVSGMAALIYEIVWQRVLFAELGINIESVTIIVSLFMFGLGVGSLVGGVFSNRYPNRLPQLFIFCELAIGVFGIISLPLIKFVSRRTLDLPLPQITLVVFALLALPTIFMGATLPILVTYLYRHYKHVGRSVSKLYFFNTLGSAAASLITVDVLFVFFGQQSTVFIAAGLNFLVGILVFRYTKALKTAKPVTEPVREIEESRPAANPAQAVPFYLALVISGVAGYISLSQEILWVRAISYATSTWPQVFGHILGFFLLGVALGSLLGKRFCEKRNLSPLLYLAWVFLIGSIAYYVSIPLFSAAFTYSRGLGIFCSYLILALVSCIFGSVLPLLSHFAIKPGTPVGVSLSRIYVANIIGSTMGPLFTGFYLMDRFSLEMNVLVVSVSGMAVAGILFLFSSGKPGIKTAFGLATALLIAGAILIHPRMFHQVLEKMLFDESYSAAKGFKYVNQTRSGIITVEPEPEGDVIYGGGGYDGTFNVNPVSDANFISRVYMLPALHPAPAEVLEIGLSGGSWAWVLSKHPDIKKLDVVEINPGYSQIIRNYPVNEEIFSDSRIVFHFDDGRRWLNRNPDRKFDFILMNTTWHWRSNTTNLLSTEFLTLAKQHLNPGGVIYYNATHSEDVIYTAAKVFKYVTTYRTFVAAGDSPFQMDADTKRRRISMFASHGKPIFDAADTASARVLDEMVHSDISNKQDAYLARNNLDAISDDNMLTEFKKITGKNKKDIKGRLYRWYNPECSWNAAP
ncbi:MAG: fused MFS/spermidine synthase [Fibrobacteria bacterium]